MATTKLGEEITIEAGADLSALQYHFVKVNSSGQAIACGDGERPIGVLQNKPDAAGKPARIVTSGQTKMVSAGTITVGTHTVSVDANSEAEASTTSADYICAEPLETAAAGQIFEGVFKGGFTKVA